MKLTIKERVLILSILPIEGKIIEMIVNQSIRTMLSFTPVEIEEFELRDTNEGIKYNTLKAKEVEFNFTKEQGQILKDSVKKVDDTGKVTIDLLPVCEKIMSFI